jgi:hypothetical protein
MAPTLITVDGTHGTRYLVDIPSTSSAKTVEILQRENDKLSIVKSWNRTFRKDVIMMMWREGTK